MKTAYSVLHTSLTSNGLSGHFFIMKACIVALVLVVFICVTLKAPVAECCKYSACKTSFVFKL